MNKTEAALQDLINAICGETGMIKSEVKLTVPKNVFLKFEEHVRQKCRDGFEYQHKGLQKIMMYGVCDNHVTIECSHD